MPKKELPDVLFVCTGNVCRSPMAEYLLRHHLGPQTIWSAGSAGVSAANGLAASAEAIEALREKNIDLTPHRSRMITRDLVDNATLIVVMTTGHALELKRRFPGIQDRVHLLAAFNSSSRGPDIQDPIGASLEIYRRTRDEIDESLMELILFLQSLKNRKAKG